MNRSVLCFCLTLVLPAKLLAEPVTTIVDNGDSAHRVDVAILGDGYTAAELTQYASDAAALAQSLLTEPPFDSYEPYFNVHRIDVTSNESGADHPERDEFKDTALDAGYNCANIQRLICVSFSAVTAVLNASVNLDQQDIVFVLVNDTEYGGSGGAYAVASIHPSSGEIAIHEIGHSFAQLADEYEGGGPSCVTSNEPFAANITLETDRNLIKWNVGGGPPIGWIDPATILPTPSDGSTNVPGLFDGGGYCNPGAGMYRPTSNSKMRSLGVPFGPINAEELVKRINFHTGPIESRTPTDEVQTIAFGTGLDFSVDLMTPVGHSIDTFWYLDQVDVQTGGDTLSLTLSELTPGPHQVFVWAHDPTPFVRNDPDLLMWDSGLWTVFVTTVDDTDGDGVDDVDDAFPADPFEQLDTDGDLIGNNADDDDDNDDIPDARDAMPLDVFAGPEVLLRRSTDRRWFSYSLNIKDNVNVIVEEKGFVGLTRNDAYTTVARGDYDGDGRPDVLVRDLVGTENGRWVLSTLDGVQVLTSGFADLTRNSSWQVMASEDFDGDGKDDLLLRHSGDGRWLVYLLDSQMIKSQGVLAMSEDLSDTLVGTGDFNDDGRIDVLLRRADGSWLMYELNGVASPSLGVPSMTTNLAFDVQTLADFNGDGKTDALLRRNDGRWFMYELDGANILNSGTMSMTENIDFSLVSDADFNGDGMRDALLRRTDGRWFLYMFNGAAVLHSGPLDMTRNPAFGIVSIDDFNGDGKADPLLRRDDGRWVLYGLDGLVPTIIAQGAPDMTRNTDWVPQTD